MWSIDNKTPYTADRAWLRDKHGVLHWIVVLKATFTIHNDGKTVVAENQEAIYRTPQYWGVPEHSSLRYDSDFVLTKKTSDVFVHGHAYAPNSSRASSLEVYLRLGQICKKLLVTGNRQWIWTGTHLRISKPESFEKMPITYERAYGGCPHNPIGTGKVIRPEFADGIPLPNIENPLQSLRSWKQTPQPDGFGPISRHWQPRIQWTGTFDSRWKQEQKPLLPEDFDPNFYQCAPIDQQTPKFLRGGEQVELFNLTPNGYLNFKIPNMRPGFITWIHGAVIPHKVRLHTVIIEPDVPRVIVVWHSAIACHHDRHQLKKTLVIEKKRIR